MFKFLRLILLQLFLSSLLLAGIGGKLAGTIVSSEGDPLPGVNILIDGTELGTASGGSGEYFILNIPPGRLTVRYMMIGRKTHVQQDVVIVADFTTTVDVVLEQISLNAEEEVMVTAERPLIQ
ncbi:MAG: carboxypeptidase regulatory-like domain-containing protein, partial [Candidatus Marinimicrobia bacterium]|nr:carboxypeptidase regulatory-like domain-containing protein [Candidatus Neomarinimicrobiota bacterium]